MHLRALLLLLSLTGFGTLGRGETRPEPARLLSEVVPEVRFTDEAQEKAEQSEDEAIQRITELTEAQVQDAYRSGQRPAQRDAHAKQHGCVRASFTVRASLPAAMRQGVFAEGHTFHAWIRFSNAVGSDDHSGLARGMAIKLLDVGAITRLLDPGTGALSPEPERWRTSIPVRNLNALETLLESLQPPRWPEAVLGQIDGVRAKRGAQLFSQNCAGCHGVRVIAGAQSEEWSVKVLPLTVIATDPMQATNFRSTTYDGTKLGLSSHTDAATGLRVVTDAIRTQAYRDAQLPATQWGTFDGFGRSNVITAPCGYKARPLVGVWATPPFLHNGSVPTIFALLSESRPIKFQVGSTEYDPEKLGLSQAAAPNTLIFNTTAVGNSNAGHWFTDDQTRAGRIGRRFTDDERYDLIAYLKAATYDDYPRTVIPRADPEPCVSDGAQNSSKEGNQILGYLKGGSSGR